MLVLALHSDHLGLHRYESGAHQGALKRTLNWLPTGAPTVIFSATLRADWFNAAWGNVVGLVAQ